MDSSEVDIVERLRTFWREVTESDGGESPQMVMTREAADEIERLRDRLEMRHAYQMIDGKMTRVEVPLGSIPDGIDCRNETIKLQDAHIAELRAALAAATPPVEGE